MEFDYIRIIELLAVLATVLAMLREIRVVAKSARSQAYFGITSQVMNLNQLQVTKPDLYNLLAIESPKEERGKAQQAWIFYMIMNLYENIYLQWKEGLIPNEVWNGWKKAMKEDFKLAGMRKQWEMNKASYTKSFAEIIDREVAVSPS